MTESKKDKERELRTKQLRKQYSRLIKKELVKICLTNDIEIESFLEEIKRSHKKIATLEKNLHVIKNSHVILNKSTAGDKDIKISMRGNLEDNGDTAIQNAYAIFKLVTDIDSEIIEITGITYPIFNQIRAKLIERCSTEFYKNEKGLSSIVIIDVNGRIILHEENGECSLYGYKEDLLFVRKVADILNSGEKNG